MKIVSLHISNKIGLLLLAFIISMGVVASPCLSDPPHSMVRLPGHIPERAIANAKWIERMDSKIEISIAFSLPLRNQQELDELLTRIYDPTDPLYGHYLTSQNFTDRFGPTQGDYDSVAAHAASLGLKITGTHPNRTLLDISGTAAVIESAFGLHLHHYQAPDNRIFYAPDNDPAVPYPLASLIVGVIGLDNAAVWHTHSRFISAEEFSQKSPYQIGTGPSGGLTPNDIQKAYNLTGLSANGSGQTLGLFELDGYNASDVNQYVSYYKLPSIPLQNVLVDGFSGKAGSGASEVTLDIELQIALAPGASKIIVYEGPNSNKGVVDTYNRIATDNLAKQISTSWGLSEGQNSSTVISSENAAFQQMAAQGQSIYASSGDSGAYDNGSTLSVDDPASQPYVVGVGGTKLFVNSDGSYSYETTWNVNNTASGGAGGGGVSSLWKIPIWQQGVASAASSTMRNVPDISLNADQYTGYSIYYKGGWHVSGGTSCASPLWAAFTARVNQVRAANGMPTLGFANPLIYQIATGPRYQTDFHDIADKTTNLFYPAETGYDNATGWSSFNGVNLLADLSLSTSTIFQTSINAPIHFPHVDASLPWQTEIAIINTSDQTVTGTLRALSNAGQPVDSKAVTLSAHGRRQITVANDFTNPTTIGYIIFDTDSTAVQGYTKLYQEGKFRAAIPAVKEANNSDIYISHIDSSALWWTGVTLVNTTLARKDLTITFNNGQSAPYTLNANERRTFTIGDLLNQPLQPDIRSAVITNASGVIGLELFATNDGKQLDGILLTDKATSTLYYPHVDSNGWWTGIVAYNPSDSACTMTITPYSAQGTSLTTTTLPLAGKGKYTGVVSQLGLPAQAAWFRIDSTRPVTGFELFGSSDGNQLAAYAGGGGTGAKAGIFAKIEKNGWTGIAFVNTEASAATVTLTAYNDNGTGVATQVLTVGGHAKVVDYAQTIFSQDIGSATYIAYSSDRNVVGFQLNGSADGTMLDGLPAM